MAEEKKEEKTEEKKEEMVPKSELEELRSSLETYKEDSEGRMEALQESLDAALEEAALKEGPPPVEDDEGLGEGETKVEEKPVEKKPASLKAPEGKTEGVEEELEAAIKEDAEFRDRTEKFQEESLLREDVRDLKEEMGDAKSRYPEMNEEEVLLGIEDGIEEDDPHQIDALAKASHLRNVGAKEGLEESLKEKIKGDLDKEKEGEISLPQSPGTPPAPKAPGEAPPVSQDEHPGPLEEEKEWSQALEKAKAEGEGA